jgi:four helix bundle protein
MKEINGAQTLMDNGVLMKIERFEDIKAWQEARSLVSHTYEAIRKNIVFRKDFRLVSQVQAAAVSCMANIAEGFSRQGDKEFIQFLFIAKSSAAEVQSHLYVALDQGYLSQTDFNLVYQQAERVSKIASGLIKYLKKPPCPTQQTQ